MPENGEYRAGLSCPLTTVTTEVCCVLFMPWWWNGIHDRLKIYCPQGREGSTPSQGTDENPSWKCP